MAYCYRAATAGKAGKVWSLSRFWVSIHSYKKQLVKNIWGKILDLAWLKFAVVAVMFLGSLVWSELPSKDVMIHSI